MGESSRAAGALGENIAAEFYTKNGYEVIKRNWYYRKFGEVDIIARKNDTLVFAEVKSRKNSEFSAACEAVNGRKQQRIKRLAEVYVSLFLQQLNTISQIRFDVAQVYGDGEIGYSVQLMENAF